MTFTLPTVNNDFNAVPTSNVRHVATTGSPTGVSLRASGGLPITTSVGDWEKDDTASGPVGFTYEFLASGGYDVSADTKVMLWHNQANAPNRIQKDTRANAGDEIRVYTGSGSPSSNYRAFYVGGNDTPMGASVSGQYPVSIDLNAIGHDASGGTFDNTDVTQYAWFGEPLTMSGTSTMWNFPGAAYVVDTTKASSNTPTFTGTSDFIDALDAVDGTGFSTKIGNWVRQIGSFIFIDMPFRIGDNSTQTNFSDQGTTIVSPSNNDTADPRNRLTTQAMRTYLNLRNNVADTAVFSETWIWGTRAPFDWDQDDAAVVTFSSPTFTGMGTFTLGSSITGPATWDDVDAVVFADTGVDIDGSTFRNPNGNHALELTLVDIADMRFESYSGKHAILIDTVGTYGFSNVFFDQSGTNDVENTSGGLVTINITNGGTTPTVTNTGGGSTTTVNNAVNVTVTVTDNTGTDLQNARVILESADGTGSLPFEDSVTITRSGSTATVTHTSHGLVTGDKVVIRGANQQEYNGPFSITVTTVNAYTYTVSGTPASPATGTIVSSGAVLEGLTDVNGEITASRTFGSNTNVKGFVRKSTTSPRFQDFNLTGNTVSSSTGLSVNVRMVLDE